MQKKSNPKDISLDEIIEANTDVKNAWKKIIFDLEEKKVKPKN